MKLLLYCTKNKWRLFFDKVKQIFSLGKIKSNNDLNGKIVAECDFEVEKIRKGWGCLNGTRYFRMSEKHYYPDFELEEHSCLSFDEMNNYLKGTLNEMSGYAIHIKNLHIFDEPKELSDYYTAPKKMDTLGWRGGAGYEWVSVSIDKAPQNMMYVYNERGYKRVLISIKPEWMCKILNKEKDIEVRKVVLKEMLSND